MGAESNAKSTPKVVKLNKALKLAEAWVNSMSASTASEPNDLQFEGRPSRLGLGAKVAPNARPAPSTDPVERRLLAKINASKRLLAKDSSKVCPNDENCHSEEDDDDDEPESRVNAVPKKRAEPESRVNAVPKKRASPAVATPWPKKQK